MLSSVEKILFAIAFLITIIAAWFAVKRLVGLISGGRGKPDWKLIPRRLGKVIIKIATFQPVFRFRLLTSIFHGLVGWGFGFYLVVNVVDVLRGYIPEFMIPGMAGNIFRLLADLFSIGVLIGIIFEIQLA